jgi:hypothetical protein
MEGLGVGCSADSLCTRKSELMFFHLFSGKDTMLKCVI